LWENYKVEITEKELQISLWDKDEFVLQTGIEENDIQFKFGIGSENSFIDLMDTEPKNLSEMLAYGFIVELDSKFQKQDHWNTLKALIKENYLKNDFEPFASWLITAIKSKNTLKFRPEKMADFVDRNFEQPKNISFVINNFIDSIINSWAGACGIKDWKSFVNNIKDIIGNKLEVIVKRKGLFMHYELQSEKINQS